MNVHAPEYREGLFFEMPEATYHALPALSASGIKWLRMSPLDFWTRSPMNPRYAEVMEGEESEFKELGTAYHRRICEGREAFEAKYVREFTLDDCPAGTLKTTAQIEAAMKLRGVPHSQGDKEAKIMRLLDADPTAHIFDVMLQDYGSRHSGKTFLSADAIERIEIAAAMIEKHPHLSKAFSGGACEVTVCWRDEETGVPMKCRMDYLKPRAIVDLKSYSNPHGKPVSRAIDAAFAQRRYFIQASLYIEAAKRIARFLRDGNAPGYAALSVELAKDHPKTFLHVWQATGVAPIARGRVFPETSNFFTIGKMEIEAAQRTYAENLARFGTDPWIDTSEIDVLDDMAIPAWAAE